MRVIAIYTAGHSRHLDAYERRDIESFMQSARRADPGVRFETVRQPMLLARTQRPWPRVS